MGLNIFVAGASGVIGRALIPQLLRAGHVVTGSTRTAEGAEKLRSLGIDAVVADVFDKETLTGAVRGAVAEIVIHQLTDLSSALDPALREETLKRNARLRAEGTANLVAAARSAGVRRVIAQSIAWAYAPKDTPFVETDPLDLDSTGPRRTTVVEGVVPLENAVLNQPDFTGLVLRYGELYGPGTWRETPDGRSPVHVEAAAYAAFLAVDRGEPGVYNVGEPGGSVIVDKAVAELGWSWDFRLGRK
jgi:nucleoside-diphosphate-sugar epimerase